MVRDRSTGRFVYTERLERREGETSWEYVRRSVRREATIRTRFDDETTKVLVGWNVDSVDDFLRAHPEHRLDRSPDAVSDGNVGPDSRDTIPEGDGVDR